MNPLTNIKTKIFVDAFLLRQWWDLAFIQEKVITKSYEDDYASKYFEKGSVGYGVSLHTFFPPAEADIEQQRPDAVADPMIRSKGIIRTADSWRHICNSDYILRTDACMGYIASVLDHFPEAYRGAVWAMKSGFKFVPHIDFPNEETYRMHIVLQTNPWALFKIDNDEFHMPADGSIWMINTGEYEHTAWNYGDSDRVHIHWQMPINTWDKYVTQDRWIHHDSA